MVMAVAVAARLWGAAARPSPMALVAFVSCGSDRFRLSGGGRVWGR